MCKLDGKKKMLHTINMHSQYLIFDVGSTCFIAAAHWLIAVVPGVVRRGVMETMWSVHWSAVTKEFADTCTKVPVAAPTVFTFWPFNIRLLFLFWIFDGKCCSYKDGSVDSFA